MVDQQARPRGIAAKLTSDGSLTKKASLNAVAFSLDGTARIAVRLVVTPFLLTRLGDTLFGIWQVLRKLIDQTTPASGRPGEALKWTIAHDQSSADVGRKRRAVGAAVAVWALFLPVLLVLGGVLAWFAPVWLDVPQDMYASVRLSGALLAVAMLLASLAYLPQSVLQGENLGYKRMGLSTSLVVLTGAMLAAAVALSWGLVGMSVAVIVSVVLTGLAYLYICATRVPWFGIARPDAAGVKSFAGLSWWFLLWNAVMRLLQASDVLLLGFAGSAALVTTYTLTRYVPQAVTVAAGMMIYSIMPGLGGLIGAREHERATRVRHETMSMIWLFTTVAASTVLVWQQPFLRLWVGGEYYPGAAAMLAIVVMVLQFALIRTDANIIDLTLSLRRKVVLGVVSAALSLALGWVLLVPVDLGVTGLVVGFVLGRAVLSVSYPLMVGRILGISPASQLASIVRPAAATAILFGVCFALAARVNAGSWAVLVLASGASAVAIALFAYFAGLAAPTRRKLSQRLRKAVRLR